MTDYNLSVSSPDSSEVVTVSKWDGGHDSGPSDLTATLDGMSGSGTTDDPYIITDDHELQAMDADTTAHYELGNHIDATGTPNWDGGSGFTPIGTFTGSLHGNGYIVKGLTIARGAPIGLFAELDGTASAVKLKGVDITETSSTWQTGALCGEGTGTIKDVAVTGRVEPHDYGGGVIGWDNGGTTVERAFVDADVVGDFNVLGGIAGVIQNGTLTDCGFVGTVESTGSTTSEGNGGLVAIGDTVDVTRGYANASITSEGDNGGIVGRGAGTFQDCYAKVSLSNGERQDAILADEFEPVSIADVYYNGHSSSYGTQRTDSEMTGSNATSNMAFDFSNYWSTVESSDSDVSADGYPILQAPPRDLQLDAQGVLA